MFWLAATAVLIWAFGGTAMVMWWYRRPLRALWREPVLRRPVLIVESDDWGPGPAEHASRLEELAQLFGRHRDRDGLPAVMTLGLTLAIPDTERIREHEFRKYYRSTLSAPHFAAIAEALRRGEAAGVFALQLHGMEHYWPPALMAAAGGDTGVRQWLSEALPATELLPSVLQSRWIEAASLPSAPIPSADVYAAVQEEVSTFESLFGRVPAVVVPPTFVWSMQVERAWVEAGVEIIVTPGRRYESRDSTGQLHVADKFLCNAQRSVSGAYYMVRDDYFEPVLGHRANRALEALAVKSRLGRPVLLETHRFNFVGDKPTTERAVKELDVLLSEALQRYPDLGFISTETLARALVRRDPAWVEGNRGRCVSVWFQRARQLRRFWRLWQFTGVGLLVGLMQGPEQATVASFAVRRQITE